MEKIETPAIRPQSFRCTIDDVEEMVMGQVLGETVDHIFLLVIDDLMPDGLAVLAKKAFEVLEPEPADAFYTEVLRANFPAGLPLNLSTPLPTTLEDLVSGLAARGDVFGVEWIGEDYRVVRILGQSSEGWHLEEIHSDGSLDEWDVADLAFFDVLHIDQRYERGIQTWLAAKGMPQMK